MATPVITTFNDAIDTYYQYVKTRILALNSGRTVAGLLQAQDWPPEKVKTESFYLVDDGPMPVGRQAYSIGSPIYLHALHWHFVIVGTDIKEGVRQANRGDRFRIMLAMENELINANYPLFTMKLHWALDGNGKWTSTAPDIPEAIFWSSMKFVPRPDKTSGKIEVVASVTLTNMLEAITS